MKNSKLLSGGIKWQKPTGKKRAIEEVQEPRLFRNMFPYTEVPKIVFDHETVPIEVPEDFWITCTTFRDGQQARPPYTAEQISTLYDMMHRLGGPNGVIRQCEFFLYSSKDRDAVEQCLELGHKYPEITGWIRAIKSDFQLVKDMGLKETGILTSASDYHIFLKLKSDRKKIMASYLDVARAAIEAGVLPRCHLEDLTRADFYGFVIPFVQELMKLADESGYPIKIRLCDTLGFGISYPGAALPRSIPKLIHGLRYEAGVPAERLEWHGHNDFHKVHINAATAWLYGCSAANGTLVGFGERTGNPPIEGLIFEYIGIKGSTCGIETEMVHEIGDYLKNTVGFPIPTNYPFVGRDFNVTRAGIHADGLIKNEEIYNIFDTHKILNRPAGVAVTDKSGAAGIALWFNSFLGLEGNDRIDKSSEGIDKIAAWITDQYSRKRTTAISPEELLKQGLKHLPQHVSQEVKVRMRKVKMF